MSYRIQVQSNNDDSIRADDLIWALENFDIRDKEICTRTCVHCYVISFNTDLIYFMLTLLLI